MNYKVLYRKYRPLTFDDVTGQTEVVKTLKNAIVNNKIAHAYIFTGPRGTGKTSLAKIFARSINCQNNNDGNPCLECYSCQNFNDNPDIIEIDAASNNGVDEIRELINNIKLAPSNSKYKVYIIDEVHMLSQSAFNALLLTLEEPPSHVIFILATTDIQNVPITILSRTQRFDFSRISLEDIKKRLKYVTEEEKIKITDEALAEIAMLAEGGLRDALSILDQLSSQTQDEITIETVINTFGTIANVKLQELVEEIENNNIENVLKLLNEFKNSSIDSKVFINKFLTTLKDKAINLKLDKISEQRLTFDDIKSLILELNEMLINKMVSIDPYIIIQMIILSYMPKDDEKMPKEAENYFPGNIKQENEPKIEEKITKKEIINQVEIKQTLINNSKINEFKEIRINNTLAAANKNILKEIKSKWQEFIEDIAKKDNNIYLNICDTKIVVASDSHFMIETLTETSAALINKDIKKVENYFNDSFASTYKMIALNTEEWKKVKNKYIIDMNNHIKYEIKEEIKLDDDQKDELEELANDIFDTSKIEIVKE